MSREHALAIWHAAVDAVRPISLMLGALAGHDPVVSAIRDSRRIHVVGAGKAGPGMALGLELALSDRLDTIEGLVNVPEGMTAPLRRVRLHAARPQGHNEPTTAGVIGAEAMLRNLNLAELDDAAICLLSGGGSALLPAPIEGITLTDKQTVTKLLHRCGASIDEMNCVRKHLSRIKGGRLAQAFRGRRMLSLIISDVIGDPLDVIASGPTAPDPTTYADAMAVIERYRLRPHIPESVLIALRRGVRGEIPETPKQDDPRVVNTIIGSNRVALAAAESHAMSLGYRVWNLGSAIAGDTTVAAQEQIELAKSIRDGTGPIRSPACILSGGETTVSLGDAVGKGGRNQEFVLAAILALGPRESHRLFIMSGGTDGEDGPTDAAGAIADRLTWQSAMLNGCDPADFLRRHDAYHFFASVGGLVQTGLTGTNVMDIRVILIE